MSALDSNLRSLDELIRDVGDAGERTPKVAVRAINNGTRRGRVQARRRAQTVINVKARSINRRARVTKASPGRLIAEIRFQEKKPPLLTSFPFTGGTPGRGKRGKPLQVRVRVGKPAQTIRGAFVRSVGGSAGGDARKVAFSRAYVNGKQVGRTPLVARTGPSILGLLQEKPGFAQAASNEHGELIVEEYANEIERVMAKLAAGGRR